MCRSIPSSPSIKLWPGLRSFSRVNWKFYEWFVRYKKWIYQMQLKVFPKVQASLLLSCLQMLSIIVIHGIMSFEVDTDFSISISMNSYMQFIRFIKMCLSLLFPTFFTYNMSRPVTKPTMWLCAQRRLRSAICDVYGHLPYPFQNPISNFYLSLEAGKSSTDSVILRKLTNVEIIFRAWTKSIKRTKLYFDD